MAKFNLAAPFEGVSGKLDKDDKLVFSQRYGITHAWEVEHSEQDPTAAQIAARTRFSTAATKAAQDMSDPEKKAEWQEIADASKGKYKTARGVAFASYYSQTSPVE
ncbi:MAG: hypothetical protein IJY67_03015 [Paludibacteraceae bacterium]|nr:hypothetical protein [Paludibacteraceae bacterium]